MDFGDRIRTILAGIKAERTNPQEIQGLQALFVVNLEPKPMAVPERPVPNGVRAG